MDRYWIALVRGGSSKHLESLGFKVYYPVLDDYVFLEATSENLPFLGRQYELRIQFIKTSSTYFLSSLKSSSKSSFPFDPPSNSDFDPPPPSDDFDQLDYSDGGSKYVLNPLFIEFGLDYQSSDQEDSLPSSSPLPDQDDIMYSKLSKKRVDNLRTSNIYTSFSFDDDPQEVNFSNSEGTSMKGSYHSCIASFGGYYDLYDEVDSLDDLSDTLSIYSSEDTLYPYEDSEDISTNQSLDQPPIEDFILDDDLPVKIKDLSLSDSFNYYVSITKEDLQKFHNSIVGRFVEGSRIKVVSGFSSGLEGVVLSINGAMSKCEVLGYRKKYVVSIPLTELAVLT